MKTAIYFLLYSFVLQQVYGDGRNSGMPELQGNFVETESPITMQWLNETAMTVIWPNETTNLMLLVVSEQFSDLEGRCLFEGYPDNADQSDFIAAVSGCFDSEETIINFGVGNEVLELLLLNNGTTILQKAIGTTDDEDHPVSMRKKRDLSEFETGGSLRSSQPKPNIEGNGNVAPIPKSLRIPLDLGYDKKLYDYFQGDHVATRNFIQELVVVSSPFFKLRGSKLPPMTWLTEGGIISYDNISITADQHCCRTSCVGDDKPDKIAKWRKGNPKPLMLFVEDLKSGGYQTTGCARMNSACGNKAGTALGIVDMSWHSYTRSQNIQSMARTFAHELGHMLGMDHDHDHHESLGCNKKGLMSYGSKPDEWSDCSVRDFEKWWRTVGVACDLVQAHYPQSCPTESDDHCPVSKMYAYKVNTARERKNCMFECPRVTSVSRSTDMFDYDGTGFRCVDVDYEAIQFGWCCLSKKTSGGIPFCGDVIVMDHIHCPETGCPIENLETQYETDAPRIHKFCQPECDYVLTADTSNHYAGFRCITTRMSVQKPSYCCNHPDAISSLPHCSNQTP